MEFEFRKDFISGQATIKTEMDHEAFATWLEMEGQSIDWIEVLLIEIELLQHRKATEYKLAGSEFDLLLTNAEAQVTNHRLMEEREDEELDDNLSFYNAEIEACCGLEDFKNLIESWLEFIS
ncbi:YacL family protein [Psychromonas hadalis]|uniref:YacL family protein n=1 Tax=Psychromonas hadalis TaxID=211669 RepID=UPI0003B33BBA|nr:YacL family protein [Psychromonas hadalis]